MPFWLKMSASAGTFTIGVVRGMARDTLIEAGPKRAVRVRHVDLGGHGARGVEQRHGAAGDLAREHPSGHFGNRRLGFDPVANALRGVLGNLDRDAQKVVQLNDRNRGRGEPHDHRRLDAGRHDGANGVGGGDDLRDRKVNADVVFEVDTFDRRSLQRRAFHAANAVDVVGKRKLAVGGYARGHVGGIEAGIGPYDHDDWDIDVRQHVLVGDNGSANSAEQDKNRQDLECNTEFEREFYPVHSADLQPDKRATASCVAPTCIAICQSGVIRQLVGGFSGEVALHESGDARLTALVAWTGASGANRRHNACEEPNTI